MRDLLRSKSPIAPSAPDAADPVDSTVAKPGGVIASPVNRVQTRLSGHDSEAGMTTAEYAVGTVAACAFSTVLYKVITNDTVLDAMKDIIVSAFKIAF